MEITSRQVDIIGVPIDLGAGRRGVDMGPSAIRIARVQKCLEELGHEVEDLGDITVSIPETESIGSERLRFMDPILETCRDLMATVRDSLEAGRLPLVLGGDHSISIGSVAGAATHLAVNDERLGVL